MMLGEHHGRSGVAAGCWRMQGGHVVIALTLINLVNFIDRGITPGAPKQFSVFVNETLSVPVEETGPWTGAIFSSFVLFYSVSIVTFGHLLHTVPRFSLLGVGVSVWVLALYGSGIAYFLERKPSAFWFYLFCRAVSGVGEASFQCIVPPYIEEFAPPGKKSAWLGLFYTAIPCGTAIGFLYGSALAPAPPASIGWGWAYLIEAIAMTPCIFFVARLPSSEALIERRAAKAAAVDASSATSRLLGSSTTCSTTTPTSSTAASATPPARVSPASARAEPSALAAAPSATVSVATTRESSPAPRCEEAGEESAWVDGAPPTLLYQLQFLVCCPAYVLLMFGYAAQTATVMGISTFGPNFLIALGLFEDQQSASASFGACAALGGMLGTPLGGWVTDRVARASLSASGAPKDSTHARSVEARALVGTITVLVGIGASLMIGAAFTLFAGRLTPAFLAMLTVGIAFTYSCSAGISRSVMLIVPRWMRSFALAFLTLNLHAWGDVPSPPIVGALGSAWAPSCMGDPLGPKCEACIGDGCRTSSWDQPYTHDQKGVLDVLLFASFYMLTSAMWWGASYVLLSSQASRIARGASAASEAGEHARGPCCINGFASQRPQPTATTDAT